MSVEALLLARSLPFLICTLEIFTWRFWNFYEHHISSETSLTPVHSTQFIFLSSLSFLNCRKINISDFTERHKRYFTSRRHKPFVDYLDEMSTTNRFSSLRFLTPSPWTGSGHTWKIQANIVLPTPGNTTLSQSPK